MDEEGLIEAVIRNRANQILPERLREFGLADAWLVSGSVFQTAWNVLTGRAANYGIKDYDIFYFDADTSWEAEDAILRRVAGAISDMGVFGRGKESGARPSLVSGQVRNRLSSFATRHRRY